MIHSSRLGPVPHLWFSKMEFGGGICNIWAVVSKGISSWPQANSPFRPFNQELIDLKDACLGVLEHGNYLRPFQSKNSQSKFLNVKREPITHSLAVKRTKEKTWSNALSTVCPKKENRPRVDSATAKHVASRSLMVHHQFSGELEWSQCHATVFCW